jgi:hemerythrin-like domain-containing protein
MLEEHAAGRALLRTMETGPAGERVAAARRYVNLLREHIDKENDVLFPLAESVLDERDQARICREFARAELACGEAAATDFADALEA